MTATVLRADARHLPLPDASVDLIVTSPPYWSLRSYTDGGEHYDGQIGAEQTPAEYIAALIECTREWMRVLKPGGSIWVNLGDKYAQDAERSRNGLSSGLEGGKPLRDAAGTIATGRRTNGVPRKSLLLLPERYRIAAVDQLGLIARAVVIWSKPNGLPESVTDRVRRSHEDWIHLTREPRYYSAVDEIRTPPRSDDRRPGTGGKWAIGAAEVVGAHAGSTDKKGRLNQYANPLGALPGSVWEIATEPLRVPAELGVDHFAAFPTEWPRRLILGWSPSGICTGCGEGRRPVVHRVTTGHDNCYQSRGDGRRDSGQSPAPYRNAAQYWAFKLAGGGDRITGYACACLEPTAPTRPAAVLDPFGGTGATALVASALGRHGISVDRSADYCRLARWRTTDPGQLAKAMRVPAPPPVAAGQASLFDVPAVTP